MATATMMEVPESQRLIALSLGKIAASRGQKGGINLHKNLLVATVLTKARAAYMIQHMNAAKQQRVAASTTTTTTSQPSSPASSTCVEMKEVKPEPTSAVGSSTTTTTSTTSSATSSVAAAPTTSLHSSPAPAPAAPQSVTPQAEAASVPEGAAGSRMQVAEIEDKENTPPPSPCRGDANSPSSLDCEKRLQGDPCVDIVKEGKAALSSRAPVSHGQHSNTTTTNTRDYVSRPSSTCCLLKRRRAMDRDHENVSAPKVRIVEARVSDSTATTTTTTTEPMQCDSPQISNLVNIFNTSFSGLSGASGASGGEVSVRSVGQSILSSVSTSHHKLSDSNNLTCAKEMTKVGLDSLHHPLVLSV